MLNAAKNFFLGFINLGLFVIIAGYITLTFFVPGNWIVVFGLFVVYLIYAFWSASRANTHESPDAATKDIFGDIITLLISFGMALTWAILPSSSNVEILNSDLYMTNLVYLWGMFAITLIETIATVSFSSNQLFRINPITRDPVAWICLPKTI